MAYRITRSTREEEGLLVDSEMRSGKLNFGDSKRNQNTIANEEGGRNEGSKIEDR
jgi:hypothetical protein